MPALSSTRPNPWALALGLTLLLPLTGRADDWPQWLGPRRDGVWRETGITEKPSKDAKYLWRVKIGAGYAGPAVADGRVYVTDRVLAGGAKNPDNPFARDVSVPGQERVLCLDEKTGEILWKHEYDCPYEVSYASGPRATPVIEGDKVWTLGTMGDLLCLNVKDGSVVWSRKLPQDYNARVPVWGYSAHPLIEGDLVITLAGGKGSAAVAFDKNTGKEVWKNLTSTEIGYAPPVVFEIGGRRQLIIWHPEGVYGLDPKTGQQYWGYRYPSRGQLKAGMSIPTPRYQDGQIFVTNFYNGSLMLKLDKEGRNPQKVWAKEGRSVEPDDTEGLHSVMVTPFWVGDNIYGVDSYGELRCLEADTGNRLWSTRQPTSGGPPLRWGNAFLIRHEEKFFLFNEAGDLILAHLSPKGYQELDRVNLLPPTNTMAGGRFPPANRRVVWTFPAFANRCVVVRNDNEIVRVSLAARDPE